MSIQAVEHELCVKIVEFCEQNRRSEAALLEAEMFECTDLASLCELRDKWLEKEETGESQRS